MAQKVEAGSKSSNFYGVLRLIKYRNECIRKAENYRAYFENEQVEDKGFKYLLLMDLQCLEAYITDTRIQARLSFWLCALVAIFGALLLFGAIGLGIASQLMPHMPPIQVAYLTAIAGIFTQIMSGVFFYFYNMTLGQINRFHTGLEASRKVCVSLYLQSLLKDSPTEQNKARLLLIKLLASAGQSDQLDQADEGKQNKKPHEAEITSSTRS